MLSSAGGVRFLPLLGNKLFPEGNVWFGFGVCAVRPGRQV
jgi:hypothetical protein